MIGATYFLDNKVCNSWQDEPSVSLTINYQGQLYRVYIQGPEKGQDSYCIAHLLITTYPETTITGAIIYIDGDGRASLRIHCHGKMVFPITRKGVWNADTLINLFEVDPEFRLQILRAREILFLASPAYKRICAMYESM